MLAIFFIKINGFINRHFAGAIVLQHGEMLGIICGQCGQWPAAAHKITDGLIGHQPVALTHLNKHGHGQIIGQKRRIIFVQFAG